MAEPRLHFNIEEVMKYDTGPTVEIIRQMAVQADYLANDLARQALKMEEDGDLTKSADVLQSIRGFNGNLRTDLLITRPLRETMRDETH